MLSVHKVIYFLQALSYFKVQRTESLEAKELAQVLAVNKNSLNPHIRFTAQVLKH